MSVRAASGGTTAPREPSKGTTTTGESTAKRRKPRQIGRASSHNCFARLSLTRNVAEDEEVIRRSHEPCPSAAPPTICQRRRERPHRRARHRCPRREPVMISADAPPHAEPSSPDQPSPHQTHAHDPKPDATPPEPPTTASSATTYQHAPQHPATSTTRHRSPAALPLHALRGALSAVMHLATRVGNHLSGMTLGTEDAPLRTASDRALVAER